MQIELVKINDLKPAEYNPRKWDDKMIEDLKASVAKFGLVDPLIVNGAKERKNIVIGGHFRLFVAKQMGFTDVPVVYVNIPDETTERELNLRLNKNSGEWDWKALVEFDEDLLQSIGFSQDELLVNFGLKDVDLQQIDYDRLNVLTVIPPESPELKERVEIKFESFDEFSKVKEAVKSGKITNKTLLSLL